MKEFNLLARYPKAKRNIAARQEAVPREREVAMRFGREYFDGDRTQGYGGYRYDGRWKAIAEHMVEHWGLKDGCSILDVGCAKGFLMHDFRLVLPNARVWGLDVSKYAIDTAMDDVKRRIVKGSAEALPFPDKSFDAVIAINTIHNLPVGRCKRAVREMERVSRAHKYIQVDSWLNEEQRQNFLRWVLTAVTYFDPDGWRRLFADAGYTGEYYWTLTE